MLALNLKILTTYLRKLDANNNKAWFDAHRPQYDKLIGDWLDVVQQVINQLAVHDETVSMIKPKDCLYRMHRDVRFSKDKTPYNTDFRAVIVPEGKKSGMPGYYFRIGPHGDSFVAGGIHSPEPEQLNILRHFIDDHYPHWQSVVEDPEFVQVFHELGGESLKRVPKGFDPESPAGEALKLKNYTVFSPLPIAAISTPEQLVAEVVDKMKTMMPFIELLREGAHYDPE